jgi:glycosyltransferase involved in cell wall biosynthesis
VTVLHVAAGNAYGGIERMLATVAGLPHPRLTQHFAVSFTGRLERELVAEGAPVHRLPSPRAARPIRVMRARRAFATLLSDIAPDITIFHGAWPHVIYAAVARRAGRRIAFWQHQPIARPAWPDRWASRVRPDFVIYNSRFTQLSPAFRDVAGTVMYYPVAAPPSVSPGDRSALRKKLGAGDGDVVVLLAARLEKWKGQTVLLDAVSRLKRDSRIHVWMAGGPQSERETKYFDDIAARASAADIRDRVTLLGQREDVPLLNGLADIYCQPNLQPEPFGISVAEAMLSALPCVISAGGGAAELLDESCGVMTAAGDADGVAAALDRIASDDDLRTAMGRAARARASRLTDPIGRLDDLATLVATHAQG